MAEKAQIFRFLGLKRVKLYKMAWNLITLSMAVSNAYRIEPNTNFKGFVRPLQKITFRLIQGVSGWK